MATIIIGDQATRTKPTTDLAPELALDRILARTYGAGSFIRPRNGERWRDGGQTFRGYCDIYRPCRARHERGASELVDSHVWIEVTA